VLKVSAWLANFASPQPETADAPARVELPIPGPARQPWRAISESSAYTLLLALIVGYAIVFSLASAAKYWWFGQGHDLVLHEQAIWNTVHGRIFEVTGFVHPSRLFGYDPYLIELLVVPLYALIPSVHTLFVLQSAALALGALAIWRLARDAGLVPLLALLAAVIYLATPTVQYTNLDAFRERSLGLCFFLWAMWAFRRERWRTFLALLVLLIICRLEAALFASCFGVYAWLCGRRGRWVIAPLALGLGYFFIGNFVFVPLVNQGQPVSYVYEYFKPLGRSMGEVLRTVVTDPLYTLSVSFSWRKVIYLLLLLLPTAGLALLAPRELIFMVPVLGLNLLATKPELSNVRYWYSALLVGPLIVAAIGGLRRVQQWRPQLPPWLVALPVLFALAVANLVTPNPVISLLRNHESPERLTAANALVAQIPADARVAASGRLAPHLLRRYLYYYPLADQTVLPELDYIAIDVGLGASSFNDPPSRAQLDALLRSDQWELVLDEQGFQLFKRRLSGAN
jgi:uncharacterized membrane protein